MRSDRQKDSGRGPNGGPCVADGGAPTEMRSVMGMPDCEIEHVSFEDAAADNVAPLEPWAVMPRGLVLGVRTPRVAPNNGQRFEGWAY